MDETCNGLINNYNTLHSPNKSFSLNQYNAFSLHSFTVCQDTTKIHHARCVLKSLKSRPSPSPLVLSPACCHRPIDILMRLSIRLIRSLLLQRDREAVDTKKLAYRIDDQHRPPKVRNNGENEISPEVRQLKASANRRKAEPGEVRKNCSSDQREDQNGPIREWLLCEMRQDDLGRHAAKDEALRQAEKHKAILLEQN